MKVECQAKPNFAIVFIYKGAALEEWGGGREEANYVILLWSIVHSLSYGSLILTRGSSCATILLNIVLLNIYALNHFQVLVLNLERHKVGTKCNLKHFFAI